MKPTSRLLLGPGPTNVSNAVKDSARRYEIGHLDPILLEMLDEISENFRHILNTSVQFSLPISGTGSAGMEALIMNLVNPSDRVLVGVNGAFGLRAVEMFKRREAVVEIVEARWGTAIDQEIFISEIEKRSPKIAWIVHAETSTGVRNDIDRIGHNKKDTIFIVDCVTSAGGIEIKMDEWGIDAIVSASQKCLGSYPGLSPIAISPRGLESLVESKSWYLDLRQIADYALRGGSRKYHHTAPTSLIVALYEALVEINHIGLEKVLTQHEQAGRLLWNELRNMGFELVVDEKHRLPQLTTLYCGERIKDDVEFRHRLLDDFNIEIGGGLGIFQGKILRIGLMGCNANVETVDRFLECFRKCLD